MRSTAMTPPIRAIVFAALVVCVTASSAHSQAANVKRIDVTEHGIYTADITKKQPAQAGVTHNTVTNIRHAVTTRTVPAQLGVHFGFRYRIVGAPNAAPMTVTKVTIFLPTGLNKPGVAKAIRRSEYKLSRKIGEVSYTDYSFDQPWEVVPGTWTFELWVGNRKLAHRPSTSPNSNLDACAARRLVRAPLACGRESAFRMREGSRGKNTDPQAGRTA